MAGDQHQRPSARHVIGLVYEILKHERSFFGLAIIYGVAISLMSLATPIAVQVLINSVGYTALTVPLVVLTVTLFVLLIASGLMNALRLHLMEIFGRRFYARMTSEMALRSRYAQNPFFLDDGRGPLFNRYFDIMQVQKAVPLLMVGGFTVILQAAVGFILTSFYHPLFLAFNMILVLLLLSVWWIWGPAAIRSAVDLSQAKHRTAAWLEGLGASNGYFKSDAHIAYALQRTDEATGDYISAHRKHFRRHFSQTLSFLFLYALASAALLGLGAAVGRSSEDVEVDLESARRQASARETPGREARRAVLAQRGRNVVREALLDRARQERPGLAEDRVRHLVGERAREVVRVAREHDPSVRRRPEALGVGGRIGRVPVEARPLLDPDLEVLEVRVGEHREELGAEALEPRFAALGLDARGREDAPALEGQHGRRRRRHAREEQCARDAGERQKAGAGAGPGRGLRVVHTKTYPAPKAPRARVGRRSGDETVA